MNNPYESAEFPSLGGPRTPAGKAQSCRNALKHGLTATTLLPTVLGPEILEAHLQRLAAEWQPQTATEKILVREMARHAAALHMVEVAEAAVLRCAAGAIGQLPPERIADDDYVLAAAVTSEAVDRVTRYRRAHEKAFHQALSHLEALRKHAPASLRPPAPAPPFSFSEHGCRDYPLRRLRAADFVCPRCGNGKGYPLGSRSCWQCGACGRQAGLRVGTVMEGSHIPLSVWFAAIWKLSEAPDASLATLADITKISRVQTLRKMVGKILLAMASPDASRLLAGLNDLYRNQRGGA